MSITALEYVIIVLTVQVKKLALTGLNQREISGCISPVFLGITDTVQNYLCYCSEPEYAVGSGLRFDLSE